MTNEQSLGRSLAILGVIFALIMAACFFVSLGWPKIFLEKTMEPTQVGDTGKLVPLKGSEKPDESMGSSAVAGYSYNLKTVVVNLPPGETFMYIIPKTQAHEMVLSNRGDDAYVTAKRTLYEKPRRITIWGAGSSPHTWEPLLYIQEH